MVTKEKLAEHKFEPAKTNKASYMVTKDDLAGFDEDAAELPSDVDSVIFEYCQNLGIKRVNAQIAEYCHTNEKTLREYLNGTRRITRSFLYKLTVGLGLTIEEANKLFKKCGGELRKEGCMEDFIVLCAIEDGDDIEDFIENFNEFVPESSRLK